VAWSGLEIAALEKPVFQPQPALLPDEVQPQPTTLEIVQVEVGSGTSQLSWSDLEVFTPPASPLR
jgi:hypothetical protein